MVINCDHWLETYDLPAFENKKYPPLKIVSTILACIVFVDN